AHRDPESDIGEQTEQADDGHSTEEAEFLTDDREDEVVVGVGQIAPLRAALTEPTPPQAAVRERELRLSRLVTGTLRVVAGVEEGPHTLRAVAGRQGQDHR